MHAEVRGELSFSRISTFAPPGVAGRFRVPSMNRALSYPRDTYRITRGILGTQLRPLIPSISILVTRITSTIR